MSNIAEQLATLQTNLEAAKQTLADNLTLNHLETTTASTLTEMAESAANVPGTYYQSYIDLVEGAAITDLTIPKSVMQIGDYKYSGVTTLATLTFEEGSLCWRIGTGTFDGCTGLTNINWNGITGLTTIGNQAFNSCHSLETFVFPASIQTIGSDAFARISSLTAVTFEEGSQLTYIGGYAFGECYGIEKVILPEGLVELAENVFRYDDFTFISLPSTLTTIGSNCFGRNSSLLKIVCNGTTAPTLADNVFSDGTTDHTGYIYIPQGADYSSWESQIGNFTLIEMGDYDIRIYDSGGTYTDYVYDDRSLPSEGYAGDESIYGVELGSTITEIPANCFSGCTNLTALTLSEYISSVGENAIPTVQDLTVGIPSIPNNFLYGNGSIRNLTLTSAVTSIGDSAFQQCSALTSITLPTTVNAIGNSSFKECYSLSSVHIPSNILTINGGAFEGCEGLTSLTFDEGCTTIGGNAFHYCPSLTSVTLPASLSTFDGGYNFGDCTGMTEFTMLSQDITSIPNLMLFNCNHLTSITMHAATCPSIESRSLDINHNNGGVLHVPTGADYSSWLEALGDGWTVEYFDV